VNPSSSSSPRPYGARADGPSTRISAEAAADAPAAADFAPLRLVPELLRAVADAGYTQPTSIQIQAIPLILEGRDLLGCAQTGTGKTAAFLLPILQRMAASPSTGAIRALVLAPTRELAAQIGESAAAYGRGTGLRHVVIYGGVGQRPQEDALRRRPDILVATPGRLLDLVKQGHVRLDGVEFFVLDEADRMLDMGFIHDVRRVVAKLTKKRQTLLFSATMPPAVVSLAEGLLHAPARVSVTPQVTTAARVEQIVHFVAREEKRAALTRLLRGPGVVRSIVFTRTKHGANRVAEQLSRAGIEAAAIHGNKSQGARERALAGFRKGTVTVLVATDIAARGIDVDGVTHVFNYELPNVPESYVHRIGRTGRADAAGVAVSLCDTEERKLLKDIERFIGRPIARADGTAALADGAASAGWGRATAPPNAAAEGARSTGAVRAAWRDAASPAHERSRDACAAVAASARAVRDPE
jgi:ATP-dependent RNA helicase RhlE